jgi:hypothetical protein
MSHEAQRKLLPYPDWITSTCGFHPSACGNWDIEDFQLGQSYTGLADWRERSRAHDLVFLQQKHSFRE